MFPRRETPPILTSVPAFFGNASILAAGLMVAWWVNFRVRVEDFRPGGIGLVTCTLVIALFYVQYAQQLGALPLVVLPLLLGLVLVPLYLHRRRTKLSADRTVPNLRVSQLVVVGLLPVTATITYALALWLDMDRLPIPLIVYIATGAAGFVLLLLSIVIVSTSFD
jgi:hypothetical protein